MSERGILSNPVFRAVFLASMVSNLGTFIEDVGEAWLMVKLGGSVLQIALVSATTWFPAVVFTLPAGVLADQLDRRKVLIWAQGWMALSALTLGVCSMMHWITPNWLLVATTSLGIGAAINGPAWSTLIPELVPPESLPEAIAYQSLNWNIARALGPLLGGLLVAKLGPSIAFLLNAVSFVGVLFVMAGTSPRPASAARESMLRSIRAGFAHFTGSRDLRAVMTSTAIFGFFASPLMSLLPAFVARELKESSTSFGMLLGSFGSGALLGAVVLRRVRTRLEPRHMVPLYMLIHGIGTFAFSRMPTRNLGICVLPFCGMCWLTILSTQNTLLQLVAPAWVRGRVKSIDNLMFLGAYAVGGSLGGFIANHVGVRPVLSGTAVGIVLSALFALHARLPGMDRPAVTAT